MRKVRSMRPFYGVAIRVAARCRIHMVVDAATNAAPKSNKRYAIHDGPSVAAATRLRSLLCFGSINCAGFDAASTTFAAVAPPAPSLFEETGQAVAAVVTRLSPRLSSSAGAAATAARPASAARF